jgi:hypothetical protein
MSAAARNETERETKERENAADRAVSGLANIWIPVGGIERVVDFPFAGGGYRG